MGSKILRATEVDEISRNDRSQCLVDIDSNKERSFCKLRDIQLVSRSLDSSDRSGESDYFSTFNQVLLEARSQPHTVNRSCATTATRHGLNQRLPPVVLLRSSP